MLGISPRPTSLTQPQRNISKTISESVPELPVTITDLISEFAQPDFELAAVPLQLDQDGAVVQNQSNQSIIAMIEIALTSPSSECAPWIKSKIFANATGNLPGDKRIHPYLVQIINRLQCAGEQINLDDAHFEYFNLTRQDGLDFSSISAQRTTFYHVHFFQFNMARANFAGAKFVHTLIVDGDLTQAIITDARFELTTIHGTLASGLIGNQSAILNCSQTYPETVVLNNVQTVKFNIYLNLSTHVAIPDLGTYTLVPKKLYGGTTARGSI